MHTSIFSQFFNKPKKHTTGTTPTRLSTDTITPGFSHYLSLSPSLSHDNSSIDVSPAYGEDGTLFFTAAEWFKLDHHMAILWPTRPISDNSPGDIFGMGELGSFKVIAFHGIINGRMYLTVESEIPKRNGQFFKRI